jgi:hypothetical protein
MDKKTFLFFFFLFFMQLSFAPLAGGKLEFNFLLFFIICLFSLSKDLFRSNMLWLFIAGTLFDLFSHFFFGFGIVLFLSVGLLVNFYQKIISFGGKNFMSFFFLATIIKVFFDGLYLLLQKSLVFLGLVKPCFDELNFVNYFSKSLFFVLSVSLFCFFLSKTKMFRKNEIKLN